MNKNYFSLIVLTVFYLHELVPDGGRDEGLNSEVSQFVFGYLTKACLFPLLFISLLLIFHCCNIYPPLLGNLNFLVSVNCILSYFDRLYVVSRTLIFVYFSDV